MRYLFTLIFFCSFNALSAQTITTIAGIPDSVGTTVDGLYATATKLYAPAALALNAKGELFVGVYPGYIKKISTTGIISTYAGDGTRWLGADSGNGGPATATMIDIPSSMCCDQYGNLYMAMPYSVRMIDTAGIIHTLAGNGTPGRGNTGNGGPATAAGVSECTGVYVDAMNNIYFNDSATGSGSGVVRKIDRAGIVHHFAGNGFGGNYGDGGPATAAQLTPVSLCGDLEGNVYIASYCRIRKVAPNGIITTFAGSDTCGHTGDGGPATNAQFTRTYSIACDSRGNIYITEQTGFCVRKASPNGIITTFAGRYSNQGYSGDGGPATAAKMKGVGRITVGPDQSIYVSDIGAHTVRRITSPYAAVEQITTGGWLNVYPNPSHNGQFKVQIDQPAPTSIQVAVTTLLGATVYNWQGLSTDLEDISLERPGVYIVTVQAGDRKWSRHLLFE